MDKPTMTYVHTQEEDQVGETWRIKEVLRSWNNDGNARRKEERWKMVPTYIWWTIWKERNQKCFEGKKSHIQKIKTDCLRLDYFWNIQVIIDNTELANGQDRINRIGFIGTDPRYRNRVLPKPILPEISNGSVRSLSYRIGTGLDRTGTDSYRIIYVPVIIIF
ncbi:hypothetical protein H5410_002495 [Solanum commersonii]|uniref:Uncharacterized protein n=1 Tax=Solanum commersonii TaxID=4109 RepID=A0A9J6B2G5_SOLCO|nr:hypothetical protein H5410_002495 [Solanum commersonii]